MPFIPSGYADAAYGWDEPDYATQQMLTTYQSGAGYGFIDALASIVTTPIAAIHEGKQAKRDREQELKMEKLRQKGLSSEIALAQAQAETAAAQTAGTVAMAQWVGLSAVTVGLAMAVVMKKKGKK